MNVKVEGKNLVITLPLTETKSKSGKSIVIATTNGNKDSGLKFKDKPVILGVNAYIAAE